MPDVPEGSIVITPEQMYRDTHEQFGKISESLDGLKRDLHPLPTQVAEHDAYINELRSAGLPGRFSQLEREVAVLKGKWMWLAGAGFVASLLVGLFGSAIASALIK